MCVVAALAPVALLQYPAMSSGSTIVLRFLFLVQPLLLIPLAGLLILLLAALPALLGRPYPREGFRFHAFNLLTAVLLLAILTGLSGMLTLWDGAYSTGTFLVGAMAVLVAHLVVLRRHLAFDVPRAAVGALVLSLFYVYLWYLSVEAHISQILTFMDLMFAVLPLLLLVFLALLLFEAYRNHTMEERAVTPAAIGTGDAPDRRERMLRLGEMWVLSTVGAMFVLLALAA